MSTEQTATYEIYVADLSKGRGAKFHFVSPFTEEIQVATYLVDSWMMKMLPLDFVGEFIKRTNKKMWQDYTGEKDEEEAPSPAAAPAAAPAQRISETPPPIFGSSTMSFGTTSFGMAARPAVAPAVVAPAAPAPQPLQMDQSTRKVQDWDAIVFTAQDLQQIRDSILASLKKEQHRRLFFDMLPKSKNHPYLCVKKGAATHADVMLDMLRRGSGIVF